MAPLASLRREGEETAVLVDIHAAGPLAIPLPHSRQWADARAALLADLDA